MAKLTIENARMVLQCGFVEGGLARAIPGAQWERDLRAWLYPLRPRTVDMLLKQFPGLEVVGKLPEANLEPVPVVDAGEARKGQPPLALMPLKAGTIPMQHQIDGYNMGITKPNVALLFEQGCGKTLAAVAIAGRRFQWGQIKRVLIVAPSSVVSVWPLEFATWAGFPADVFVLDGPIKRRIELVEHKRSMQRAFPLNHLEVFVTNYQAFHQTTGEGRSRSNLMAEALAAWGPDMIILDESQRIKAPNSIQSKTLRKLGQSARYRLILTGTPIGNGPLDLWSQWDFLDPKLFNCNFYSYRNKYCKMGGYYDKQVVAYKILPYMPDGRPNRYYEEAKEKEFFAKAYSCAIRVTKAEALDLPPFTDQVLKCKLEPKAAKIYNDMAAENVLQLAALEKGGAPVQVMAQNVLSRLLRLSQITGGFVSYQKEDTELMKITKQSEQVSSAKLKLLQETLEDLVIDGGQKVVVFGRFTPELMAIKAMAEGMDVGTCFIDGSVDISARGGIVQKFQNDPHYKIFVAQTKTAGLGITLTSAHYEIFYSLDYSYIDYDQARARIHRTGQKNACTYLHLLAEGSVDEKVMEALGTKRDVADLVVDNWRNLFSLGGGR